jgi:hypothetical protein
MACLSSGMAGVKVCWVSLIAMVAERSWRTTLRIASRLSASTSRAGACSGEHDGQVGPDCVAGVVEHRPCSQVDLDPERRSTCHSAW